MSDYQLFSNEKQRIDDLIANGFKISNVKEDLSGGFFEFTASHNHKDKVSLHIITANARKYFFSLLIKQQREASS